MTTNAADCRRAVVLHCHYSKSNLEGLNAVFEETVEANRVSDLLIALLDLYSYIIPVLTSPLGVKCLSETVYKYANNEPNEHGRRAAKLAVAYAARDVDRMNELIQEAQAADAVTDLFLAVMNLHLKLVPALDTEIGIATLELSILDLALLESKDEQGDTATEDSDQ